MNNKGFAISVILYVIVFLIIAVLYILLGIVKARYSVNSDLKNNVTTTLNGMEYIYSKLDNEDPVNLLIVDLNGGQFYSDEVLITDKVEVLKYGDEEYTLPPITRVPDSLSAGTYSLSYNANGGYPTPPSPEPVTVTGTIEYEFNGWVTSGDCGTLNGNTYTFPKTYSTVCTMKADWGSPSPTYSDSTVSLYPNAIEKVGYRFIGWESSANSIVYGAGANYTLTQDTVMTAQWDLDAYAREISYSHSGISCSNTQCALDRLDDMLK